MEPQGGGARFSHSRSAEPQEGLSLHILCQSPTTTCLTSFTVAVIKHLRPGDFIQNAGWFGLVVLEAEEFQRVVWQLLEPGEGVTTEPLRPSLGPHPRDLSRPPQGPASQGHQRMKWGNLGEHQETTAAAEPEPLLRWPLLWTELSPLPPIHALKS